MKMKTLAALAAASMLAASPMALAQGSGAPSPGGAPAVQPEPGRAGDPQSPGLGAADASPVTTGTVHDEATIRERLTAEGYADFETFERGEFFRTRAMRDGQMVDVWVDARTGEVIR